MGNIVEVVIPDWFEYDELVALTTIAYEKDETIGLLLAGDNLDQQRPYNPVVRVYLITLHNGKYEFAKEMSAMTFNSKQAAIDFATEFSRNSAMELFVDIYRQQIDIAI